MNAAKHIIVSTETTVIKSSNENCAEAKTLYEDLNQVIGCTYMIYMYENLNTHEKRVYTSSWEWQNLLIGEKLINNCPVFLAAFNKLENVEKGHVLLPWNQALPQNKEERNVCGIRAEHDIANGIGFGGKGFGIRETLAFAGQKNDKTFHMNFLADPKIFNKMLSEMRRIILDDIKTKTNNVLTSTGFVKI